MAIIEAIALLLIIAFGGVLLFGAPYLPTLKPQIETVFGLAKLKSGDRLLELGCGDGRVLVAAAKAGYKAVGYELNPILFIIAWLRTRPYSSSVTVIWGNFWSKPWPEAELIFTFLFSRYMSKLDKKCIQYPYKPVKLISFAFKIPQKTASRHQNGLYLYDYS